MRRTPSSLERGGRKFSLDADAVDPGLSGEGEDTDAPIWDSFRQKIFSFVRSRSRSPSKSPVSKSPGSKSPTGYKSPFSITPLNRSPSAKSPSSRSPTRKAPSALSPSTPKSSPSGTPPLKSPPILPASVKRNSFSKASRESRSSSGEAEFLFISQRRNSSITSQTLKKNLALSLKKESNESFDSSSSTPGTGSPGTPIGGMRRGKGKLKASPGDFLDFQKMDDDLRFAEAALRPRKWSYHGTASPSAPVQVPKRHSFSTASDHKSGIVVSNNDLAKLLGQNRLLLPGLPLGDVAPLPVLPNPKARGRSQSIAVCAQSFPKPLTSMSSKNEPVAPITIRTTDCDHLASIKAHGSIDSQKDDEEDNNPEKLLWDSSGSTVNVNLLGSVIEKYLKTSREGEHEQGDQDDPNHEDGDDDVQGSEKVREGSLKPSEGHPGELKIPFKGLQVK